MPVRGQIAHIDRDASNNDPDNLVFLCLSHHDEYDTLPRQTKRYTPTELKRYRALLDGFIKSELPLTWITTDSASNHKKIILGAIKMKVSLEVYNKRYPIYLACKAFIIKVVQQSYVPWENIALFARETEDALFLFDSDMADYLHELYTKANLLNMNREQMTDRDTMPQAQWKRLQEEKSALFMWFTSELDAMRYRFAKYMTIRNG